MSTRALRVGVLLGENLVEEKVFRDGTPVTFGQSLKCSLSIPGDGIPHDHVLFATDQGKTLLRVTKSMQGKLAQGGKIATELHTGSPTEGVWTIALEKGARGKLQIGDATILFQEVAAPPLAPRPVLPASIRGTLGDRIDRRLAAIIGVSVAAHLAIAAYAWFDDVETNSMLETPVAMHYRQEVMDVTIPDEPTPAKVTTPDPGPGAATPVTPVQTPRPIVKPTRIGTKPTAPTTMPEDDALKFASILTGSEIGRTGANDLNKRQPGVDLNKQIEAVGNKPVVVGNDDGGFRTKPREGIGTTDGPDIRNPQNVETQKPKGEGDPTGRIVIKPLPPGDGPGTTLTVQVVLDKIQGAYMAGLQRCYKKGLLGDSKLSGKIAVSFTVTEKGGLEEIGARGVSTEVDACVGNLMESWRFPIPRDKDGDATEQPFKLSLALTPG